ncbi:oligosaccharide flippase family protein [Limosilactobacillus mucosae]|uniref:oligosaccharide flippase family protein n=1 Tax=Limosilactobacillus mucosae TaxID=97478 RepID=UPI0039958831
MKLKINKTTDNILMLYIMNISQIVLPLVVLPYLARVLSIASYGVVSYVKSIMVYSMLVIQFGFLLSGTKEVVEARNSKEKLGKVVGKITQAKLILSIPAFLILVILIFSIKILRQNPLFTVLMFIPSFLDIFIFEYLFRGLEKMNIVTIRYLISKSFSVICTFIFIKGDNQLLLIPIFDILGSFIAVLWGYQEFKKLNIKIIWDKLSNVTEALKESSLYFFSDISSTAFNALNTVCIGIFLSAKEVAFWGLILQFILAVDGLYRPLKDGVYPEMIKKRDLRLLVKVTAIFLPVVLIGCSITFFGSYWILYIVGGKKYTAASYLMKASVPLLFLLFLNSLSGWPLLGAIGKVREVTFSTVIGSIVQVIGLLILIITNHMSLFLVMVLRTISELCMLIIRLIYFNKFKNLYNKKSIAIN